jgi:hypothetical protein
MQIFEDKIYSNVNLCGVEISFNLKTIPSYINDWQRFNNNLYTGDFVKTRPAFSSLNFKEESKETPAGPLYTQTVSYRLLNNDSLKANRIELLQKINYIKLKLTNGKHLLIGRNDFEQNAKPKIETKQNQQFVEVEVSCDSIFSVGYVPSPEDAGLPVLLPFDFYFTQNP